VLRPRIALLLPGIAVLPRARRRGALTLRMRDPDEDELDRLMAQLAQGERDAFAPLFRALHPRALRLARARLGPDGAADAAQAAPGRGRSLGPGAAPKRRLVSPAAAMRTSRDQPRYGAHGRPQYPSLAQSWLQQSLSTSHASLSARQLVTGIPQAPSLAQMPLQQSASTSQAELSAKQASTGSGSAVTVQPAVKSIEPATTRDRAARSDFMFSSGV
jgi:hypothetical protein